MQSILLFWIATIVVLASFALTLGLTWLPCYASLCVEDNFPVQVRIHVVYYYICLVITALVLILRKNVAKIYTLSERLVSTKLIPYTSMRLSYGGLLMGFWILLLVGLPQAYWYIPERNFYRERQLKIIQSTQAAWKIAAIGTTGHLCDILMGLIILPVSRDSALGRQLGLETFTLLRFHKLVAYLLIFLTGFHGVWFYSWISDFVTNPKIRQTMQVDAPNISIEDPKWYKGIYYTHFVAGTGFIPWVIMIAILITSLPKLRRKSYNTFYYVHLLSIVIFILICIHASTDFYMLLPGLCLWILDWIIRLRGSGTKVKAQLQNEGNGWYRITVPIVTKTLVKRLENTIEWPLKAFYLNIPEISKAQNHAFTTCTALTPESKEVSFLWRVPNLGKKEKVLDKEWTVKLSKLVSEVEDVEHAASSEIPYKQSRAINVRMEGPYITPHNPFDSNDSILCIVGGTGITGALSLAEHYQTGPESSITRFGIVWSLKEYEQIDLPEVQRLSQHSKTVEMTTHLTGPGRTRINFEQVVKDWQQTRKMEHGGKGKTWIYFSGPDAFMNIGETACMDWNDIVTVPQDKLDWYCARWDV